MGARGPAPKRDAERRRRNKPAGGEATKAPSGAAEVKAPSLPRKYDERCPRCEGLGVRISHGVADTCPGCKGVGHVEVPMHPFAVSWYRSLAQSGQAKFYEPSDWQLARYLALEMARALRKPMSPMAVQAITGSMGDLLVSEGSRRRVRIELEKPREGGDASVSVLDHYRDMNG